MATPALSQVEAAQLGQKRRGVVLLRQTVITLARPRWPMSILDAVASQCDGFAFVENRIMNRWIRLSIHQPGSDMKNILRLSPIVMGFWMFSTQAQVGAGSETTNKPDESVAASPFSANVTLASQYVSRGFRQTWGNPALQGGLDYVHPSGFSVGTWLSTIDKKYIESGHLEWDLYGGYDGAAGDWGYSLMAYYYQYPGAVISATGTKFNYGEISLGVTQGFLYAKYYRTVTPEYFGITDARGTVYWDIGANPELGGGYTLNLHYGLGRVASRGAADNAVWNWKDYKVGLSKSFEGGWTLAGAYTRAKGSTSIYDQYSTGLPGAAVSNPARGTLVVSLNKVF